MEKELKFRGGLKFQEDERDFPLGSILGVETDLPKEFLVSGAHKLKVKNQGGTDLCSAFALTACSELQELDANGNPIELNPEFQFAQTKRTEGGDINSWGGDGRCGCEAIVKYGSLEQMDYLLGWKGKGTTRDWKNWGADLVYLAEKHKKQSYARADIGFGNKFDLIKSALFKQDEAVFAGLEWKYTHCENGIIEPNDLQGFGHGVALLGWKIINDKEYMIIHNSVGRDLGDKGWWYLPRDMKGEIWFGFTLLDMPKEEVEFMLKNNIQITDNWFQRIIKIIKNYLKKLWV